MKNILKISWLLTVLFCSVSCNEMIEESLNVTSNYITITSDVDSQVKAGYNEKYCLPSKFYIDIMQGDDQIYKGLVDLVEGTNRYQFRGATHPQWTGYSLKDVYVRAMTVPANLDGEVDLENISTVQVLSDQSKESYVETSDLLGATTDLGITLRGNNINVTFSHLLSKLCVEYNTSEPVSSISIINICTSGEYNFEAMKPHSNSSPNGSVTMCLNSDNVSSAEAIFYPYTLGENQTAPTIEVKLKNGITLTKNISLDKINNSFEGGKCYIVNIIIDGSSINGAQITQVKDWYANTDAFKQKGEQVLWVGTSIPAGNPYLNYPMLVDEAMTCRIINQSRGGTLVCKKPSPEWMKRYDKDGNHIGWEEWNALLAGGLSQTIDEAEEYREYLAEYAKTIYTSPQERDDFVKAQMDSICAWSYESLIIPYINGKKANCTTVIIDHGYNDKDNMIMVGPVFPSKEGDLRSKEYLQLLKEKKLTPDEFGKYISDNPNTYIEASYINCMAFIIDEIKKVNSNIKIIIGNYFTQDNPYLYEYYKAGNDSHKQWPDYKDFTKLICYHNEAIAGYFDLQIVNVYEYLSIDDNMFYNPDLIPDYTKFCPDGVHPSHPSAVRAIADVYINELDGVVGSRE